MSLLDPRLLAFMAIARLNTVHAAAEELCVTQTAVTQRIKALEQKLQTTLFARTRRGMLLTPEGETLLRYCKTVEDLGGKALSSIKGAGASSSVAVVMTGATSIMRSRIIPACVPVMKHYKELLMRFDVADDDLAESKMKRGATQLAIMPAESVTAEMEVKELKPERYVLVGSHQWKGRKLKDILEKEIIIDFNQQDRMTLDYLKHYGLYDNIRHERHYVNRTEALATLITEGLGYTVLTTEFAKRFVDEGSMIILNHNQSFLHPVSLVWYTRPDVPAYFQALLDVVN